VKKVTPQGTTVYVYDAFRRVVAEYASGSYLAEPCSTCYITRDHLGSTRMITDQNAYLVARHDYQPFGEEIYGGIAGRDLGSVLTTQEQGTASPLDWRLTWTPLWCSRRAKSSQFDLR
jgi:hypothetical protein